MAKTYIYLSEGHGACLIFSEDFFYINIKKSVWKIIFWWSFSAKNLSLNHPLQVGDILILGSTAFSNTTYMKFGEEEHC